MGKKFILSNDQIAEAIVEYAERIFGWTAGAVKFKWQAEVIDGGFRLTHLVLDFKAADTTAASHAGEPSNQDSEINET